MHVLSLAHNIQLTAETTNIMYIYQSSVLQHTIDIAPRGMGSELYKSF